MSVLWLTPVALLGIALVALPIAIHWLVREQSRRVEFPSLRFLRQSQLAAFRRRTVQDALLLLCRVAILTVAVAALAGPVLQTASRSAMYAQRVARAVVLEPGLAADAAPDVGNAAFVSRVFARDHVADAIADANRWLNQQPPAARELVFAGALRRGGIMAAHLAPIAASTGIRFVATASVPATRDLTWPILHSLGEGGPGPDGRLAIEQRRVHLEDEVTRVSEGPVTLVSGDLVRIVAASADQRLADAALRAALSSGVRWSNSARRVLIAWDGADEPTVQRTAAGASLVRMTRPEPASSAASEVAAAIERVAARSITQLEPVRISEAKLQAWSRPGAVPSEARPMDEGDRRWFWGLVLVLLTIEHWLRRARSSRAVAEPPVEARVA